MWVNIKVLRYSGDPSFGGRGFTQLTFNSQLIDSVAFMKYSSAHICVSEMVISALLRGDEGPRNG